MAIEVFHNFTLMHDDIMDKALMRRNRHAVHVKWTPNIALLSGDAMVIKAYELLAEIKGTPFFTQYFPCLMKQHSRYVKDSNMIWILNAVTDISEEDYLHMVELKTAVLLAASLKIGAIIGRSRWKRMRICFMNSGEILALHFSCRMIFLMCMPIL